MDCTRREVIQAGLAAGALAASGCAGRPQPAAGSVLPQLLARARETSPVFGGGLANHLPMALYALSDLGAGDGHLVEFSERYSQRLEPFPEPAHPLESGRWREQLGHADSLGALVRRFESEVARRGRETVLRETLPVLIPGLSAAAFHGMIRSAYGQRFADDGEVAHGLGYWAAEYTELCPLQSQGTETDPAELLARVPASPTLGRQSLSGSSIVERMHKASKLEGYALAANALRVESGSLERIARASARIFASTGDFTALHAVTGTQALRMLLPFTNDPDATLRWHWQALVAAYVGIGTPELVDPPAGELPDWDTLAAEACTRFDDHDVKLVDAARAEERAFGAGDWRWAAARRLRAV